MDNSLDKTIEESLKHCTDNALKHKESIWQNIQDSIKQEGSIDNKAEQKKIIWRNIQRELKLNQGGETRMNAKKQRIKRRRSFFMRFATGTVAAAMAITFMVGTQTGRQTVQAAFDGIRSLFAPEKNITEYVEGIGEENTIALKEGSTGYVIYFDEEAYMLQTGDGYDRVVPRVKADYIPEVYMEIRHAADKDSHVLASEIEGQMAGKYENIQEQRAVSNPLEAIALTYVVTNTKWNWDDELIKFYLVDDTKGGTYIIKQQLFIEAEEGHGERFNNMLRQFVIVDLEE